MASELRVDKIIPTTGIPTGGGGGIIQIQQDTLISQTESTASNGTRVDVGLEASITPKFSTSKIYVTLNSFSLRTRSQSTQATMILQRKIGGGSFADVVAFAEYAGVIGGGTSGSTQEVYPTLGYLDSPATTSAVTYKIQGLRHSGSGNVAFHHNASGGHSGGSGVRNTATLVVMEVSA